MTATHEPQNCIRCAVINLVSRYSHVVDRAGADAVASLSSLFAEDATFDITPRPEGSAFPARGSMAIAELMIGRRNAGDALAKRRHLMSNVLVDNLTESRASVSSALSLVRLDQPTPTVINTGFYDDIVVRGGDDQWRFESRSLSMDYVLAKRPAIDQQ
jgi:hypothetical protein